MACHNEYFLVDSDVGQHLDISVQANGMFLTRWRRLQLLAES